MKNKVKKVLVFGLIFCLVGILVACGGSSKSTEEASTTAQTTTTAAEAPSTTAPAPSTVESKTYKVGLSVLNLSDQVMAKFVSDMKAQSEQLKFEFSVNDCNGDPTKQVNAVQNLVQAGCDAIIIQSIDANAMDPVVKDAMSKGIKIIAFGIGLNEYDCWYKNDNYKDGQAIGTMAGEWINKNKGGNAKVAMIEFPTVPVLIERAKGIEDALKVAAPNAQIVARGSGIDSAGGMKLGETFLQKNPDISVIVSISDGPALGAYQAIKVAGKDTKDFAIFGSDLTQEGISLIASGTCFRGTVDADNKINAQTTLDIVQKLLKGEAVDKIVVMGANPVTEANVNEYK